MFVLNLQPNRMMRLSVGDMDMTPPLKKVKISKRGIEVDVVNQSENHQDSEKDHGSDWREKCQTLAAKNTYALRKRILTDVTFKVGEDLTVCHAHRLILAFGSPVFEAMFYGALAEKGDTITIPDVDPEGFQNLLKFLYSDVVTFESDAEAFKTYFVADKYCVTHLKEFCERFLCHECMINPCNVWTFLENSFFLNSQALKDRSFGYLRHNIDLALKNKSFLDVNAKTIELLLGMKNLKTSEVHKLHCVLTWAEHQSKLEQADSFQNILKPLLQYVQFGELDSCEFVCLRRSTRFKELVTEQDALAILEHLIDPLFCNLPEWCNKSSKKSPCLSREAFERTVQAVLPQREEQTVHNSKLHTEEIERRSLNRLFSRAVSRLSPVVSVASTTSSSSSSSASSSSSSAENSDSEISS